MHGLAIRVIKQIRNDKRSVGLILIAPLLVLSLVYLLLSDSNYTPTVAIENSDTFSAYRDALKDEDIKVKDLPDSGIEHPKQYLKDNRKIDLVVKEGLCGGIDIYMLESSAKSGKAAKAFQNASKTVAADIRQESIENITELIDKMHDLAEKAQLMGERLQSLQAALPLPQPQEVTPPKIDLDELPTAGAIDSLQKDYDVNTYTVFGKDDASVFDNYGFVFLGFFPFFMIFLLTGFTLVRERSGGTLERFLMSPIKRREVILGYTAGYSVFAVLQAIIVVVYTVYVLNLACAGSLLWVMITMVMMAIVAVSFGSLVSIFSSTELQVVQIVPVAVIPQVFFSGLIPLDTIPYGLGNLCYIAPVFYGCSAVKKIMIEGGGFAVIWPYLLGLLLFAIVLGRLNMLALKKYRAL